MQIGNIIYDNDDFVNIFKKGTHYSWNKIGNVNEYG